MKVASPNSTSCVLIWKVRASGTIQKASRVITNGAMKRYGAHRWEYNRLFSRRGPLASRATAPTGLDRCSSVETELVCEPSVVSCDLAEGAM